MMLINPTLQGETFSQHLGLTSLASYLNARTPHRSSIIDFAFHRKQWRVYLREKIGREAPDVFGITLSTPNRFAVKTIAEELRQYGRPIVCGGPGATILPEETMKTIPVDLLCRGEGEFTMAEYLDCLEAKGCPDGIAGLWVRKGDTIIKNPPRPVNQAIDDLPYLDWTLWEDIDDMLSAYRILSFQGVRGCPHDCTYCSAVALREALPGFVRECDPERYVRHIEHQWRILGRRGFCVAWMWDQVFTTNSQWLARFAEEYTRSGLAGKLPYSVYARADELDQERAKLLADSGCIVVRIGFETGDHYMRHEIYEKKISDAAYEAAVRLCHQFDMAVTGYFMLGGPGETRASVANSYRLVRRLHLDVPTFYVYKPLPRTKALEKLAAMGGYIDDLWNTRVMDIRFGGMVHTPYLSPRQVERYQWKFIISFIPPVIFRQMLRWRLRYFAELFRYFRRNIGRGTPLLDLCRNFTYYCHIMMASRGNGTGS